MTKLHGTTPPRGRRKASPRQLHAVAAELTDAQQVLATICGLLGLPEGSDPVPALNDLLCAFDILFVERLP
jgi:hypothetical protein